MILSDYEKALLSIAAFDLKLHDLKSKAQAVLDSRRTLSIAQDSVLASTLNELEQELLEANPSWPIK